MEDGKIMNTNDLHSDFRRRGYCVAVDALSASDLADLQAVCDELLEEEPDDNGGGRYHDIGRGEARRFLRHRHLDHPRLERFLLGDTMTEVATALLGPTAVLFNEQFVVKGTETEASSFAWHQDGAYVGFDHEPYLTVWVALDDTTEENGCVYVLPRNLDEDSSLVEHRWNADGKEKVGYDGAEPGVPMTGKAGTVVAFSSTTLHRSGQNRTGRRRRAYICQYSRTPIVDPASGKLRNFATPVGRASTGGAETATQARAPTS